MPKDLMTMRRLLKFLTGRHNMKGSFECLEGFKSSMAATGIVGILNYGSATGSAPLAPLYAGYLPYSIHFGYTTLPAPAMDNFTNYPARGLSSGMAGCLQAICPQECGGYLWPGVGECSMLGGLREGCSMPHCSFSPQCQCRHKSHEFLQQYVSETLNMQFNSQELKFSFFCTIDVQTLNDQSR